MKSDSNIKSEEKYEKATELLQKVWWFCFYLVISPLTIGAVSSIIFLLFGLNVVISISLSVITFMLAFLFFLKTYDKYRDKSFFLNKENNLIARIHITFIISILSFVVTPIFTLISPDVSFGLLPLIGFAVLYNIVYYYYRFKPIAFFNIVEGEYKHGIDYKITIKQPHNFIIVINYIAHLFFLSITSRTNLSWVFALVTNLALYLITISSTKKISSSIRESIKENRSFLIQLTEYKKKFVLSITSLAFILLIQIPFVVIIVFSFLGTQYTSLELLNSSFLGIIFIFLFLKALFYVNFYYSNRIEVYRASIKSDDYKEKVPAQSVKYQKYNTYLSGILIVLITAFAFLIQSPLLVVLILPFFFIFSYSEQKAGICPKNYSKYIFLLNSIAILISIAFGLFSEIFLNYQFLIFMLSLYFILQIFVKTDYFTKENVIIIQNILATASFTVIAYSFFEYSKFENAFVFEFARFTEEPIIIWISNFMIHGLLLSIVSLISFYNLYSRYFYQKRSKLFRSCVFLNLFLIELFIFLIINLRTFFLMEILILSSLLFPSILLLFIFINYMIGVFTREDFVKISYYLLWVLIGDIFLTLLLIFLNNFVILTFDFLFLSIFSQVNLKFGLKIEKVKETVVKQFVKINSYFMTIELITLFFFFFYSVALAQLALYDNIILSTYFSFLVMTILANLLSRNDVVFSSSITIKINIIALCFSAGLACFYSFLLTFNTFYVLLVPFLCLFSILFLPIYYMLRAKIYEKVIHKILLADCILIAVFITLIPTIVNLEVNRLDFFIEIIPTINYTLYIAFGILTFTYYLLRKYRIKEIYISRVLKSQIFIEIIIAGTTVFYYFFILLVGTFYSFLFPLIAASCFLYLPSILSYRKQYFKENIVKKFIMANSILLSMLITLIPTINGLELTRLGLDIDIFIISAISLLLFFVVLNFLDFIGIWYNIKEKWTNFFKIFKVFTWFSISLFVSYIIFSYVLIDISISIIFFVFFILNIYTLRLLNSYSKDLWINNYLQEILLYGLTFSFSFLIVSLIRLSTALTFMPSLLNSFNTLWYIGLFLLISLPLILFFKSKVGFEFIKLNNRIEFVSWSILKIIVCIFISMIFSHSILALVISFSLTFTFLTPITISYFRKLKIISEKNQLIIKRFMLGIFTISLLILYIDLFYQLTTNELFFKDYLFLHISFILANSLLYLYYFLLRYNTILQIDSIVQIFGFYISSFILFFSLLYIYWIIVIIPVLLAMILLLYRRSLNLIFRFISYFLLSYIIFIDLLSIFNSSEILGGFSLILFGLLTSTYLLTIISVLIFSILLNYKRNNNLEKFALYSLFSLLSFTFLYSFTNILILYNVTISLFILLLSMGIYFYRQKNELYKWFIKPCVLLLVFDFISFISYTTLFNNPVYINFSPILTFTLTMSVTGFTFVLLYNKAPAHFRKISFYFTLFAIIVCFPTFLYCCIIAPFPSLVGDPIPVIIVINVAVFLFYLCIGIYQWRISWAIWKSGWYVWNILPFVNFLIIYQSLRGIDVLGKSISLFGVYDFSGSSIISIIICSLFFLPVIYSKIKKYFLKIIFIVWAESLFLLYWISQNLFVGDKLLITLSFILFSVILLMPLLVGLKFWKLASIFWLIPLTVINATFLYFYFISIGVSLEITISIDLLVIGLFLIVYSFFPNIRSIGIILIISYFVVLIGIFLTIYFILYSVILDVFISINFSLIVMGFSLFSSKPLKIVSKTVDHFLSWILIVNFSWLTFNTFSLLPRMEIFSFFLALTVFGCSFYIFNRYKMKFRINRVFPLLFVAIGTSSSITSLFLTLFNLTPYISITIFSGIFLVFLYFMIIEYRYFLWALIPIPLTLPILEALLTLEVFRNVWLLAFSAFSTLYIIFFQILINLFKTTVKDESEAMKNSLMKIFQEENQIKMLNLTCFLLNSIFFSLFISIIYPLLTTQLLFNEFIYLYQILDFLIVCPIFILISLKYIEFSEIDLKMRDPLLKFNRICFVIYLIIPTALAFNVLLFMLYVEITLVISVYTFFIIVSGVLFLESYVVDRRILYYLFHSTRDKFIFWSWCSFSNLLSFFFFMFYPNIFLLLVLISLLNQISLSFLSNLDISKEKISNGRIILYYTLFVSGSFYLGFLITEGIVNIFEELRGYTYYLLLFQNSILLLYILSNFIKIETKLKSSIEVILFTIFQGLFALNWIIVFNLFNILNFFSIILIILIETCFSFKTVKYFNLLFFEEKRPQFLLKTFSLLIILLYFETSLLIYGLMIEFVGLFESILISQLLFFALTLLDIYSLKKIRKNYAHLIHTISFFIISLMIIFILNNNVAQYQILLSVEVLIFILMQFYTNYSFSASLNQFYPNKIESIKKWRSNINQALGTFFYIDLCLLLLHALILTNVELQLILLSLSLMVHVLMIIDMSLMKFLGKIANYFKVISWIFIMTFTTTYLLWLYVAYFIDFLLTSIPLIIFILIIETAYLFKSLDFWEFIVSNKQKIKSYLLVISYIDFISWPIYYATPDPLHLLNLLILSLIIMFFFTYIDKYLRVIKEKLLKTLRKSSFLTIGLLFSIDVFILLSIIPITTLALNLSVSLLIFVVFLGILVKPFKEHSLKAFAFWAAIFSLISLTISELSQIWQIIPILVILMILIYPFVFLLEELRELFNNFVDILIKFLRKIELLIINAFKKLFKLIKTYFKIIWILFSASVAIFFGVLFSELILSILIGPFHPILLTIGIFLFLILVVPSSKSSDPDVIFRRRVLRLSYGWGSVIAFLFISGIDPVWYIAIILISISVVGSIVLVYLRKKEEREKIAVKWRFFTLLTLFMLLISFIILLVIQQIIIHG